MKTTHVLRVEGDGRLGEFVMSIINELWNLESMVDGLTIDVATAHGDEADWMFDGAVSATAPEVGTKTQVRRGQILSFPDGSYLVNVPALDLSAGAHTHVVADMVKDVFEKIAQERDEVIIWTVEDRDE